jgi:hypothetical protein
MANLRTSSGVKAGRRRSQLRVEGGELREKRKRSSSALNFQLKLSISSKARSQNICPLHLIRVVRPVAAVYCPPTFCSATREKTSSQKEE